MTLETSRLHLRPITEADAPDLHALDDDPEVMRHINGGVSVALDVFEREILPTFLSAADPARPHLGFHAVTDHSEAFLGWVSLRPIDERGTLELGYRFRREAWGHGYATEAAHALIDLAVADPATARIVARTYEENAASRRVMDRLGMTHVRSFRPTPEEIAAVGTSHQDSVEPWPGDDVEYALDRANWLGDRST